MAAMVGEKRSTFPTDIAGKIEVARMYKDDGNEHFKAHNYKKARITYSKAFAFTRGLPGRTKGLSEGPSAMAAQSINEADRITAEMEEEVIALEVVLHTNIATCFIKLNEGMKALEASKEALQLKPKAWKSLLRKAEATMLIRDHERALTILEEAYVHAPDEAARTAVKRMQDRAVALNKQALAKQRKAFGKIFDSSPRPTTTATSTVGGGGGTRSGTGHSNVSSSSSAGSTGGSSVDMERKLGVPPEGSSACSEEAPQMEVESSS